MPHYAIPQHVFAGKNALEEAASYIKKCGRSPLIVTGKHVGKSPMYEKLTRILEQEEITYRTFDGITGEPTDKMIEEGLSLYRESSCDFVIGIGGGSPLDSAKAIAAMSVSPGEISDYMGKEITGEIPAIVAIPTTAGTGSEATKFTIITDQGKDIKMLLKGERLIPKLAIIDPDFSMDMPKSVSAATGLDAFTHAVEAYTSRKAFSLTDTLAVSAVKRILRYLPAVYQNGYDTKAREEMAIAALEAGICINNSSVTIVHGMSRPIGALFHVPHGLSNAMLLNECIGFALDGAYERFADLGRASGAADGTDSDQVAAEKFLNKIEELCSICEVPTLKEYGIEKEVYFAAVDKMASDAIASGSPANTRKEVTKEDCMEIYRKLYVNTEN
ncbi:iron-containing alcohol dehydrogenase [Muricomes intestini]|uniref:iron-containing alcohol dehydrogenase n=1 Tax=Muricomes intestini TaxID=1796634 RepID=UPI002FD89293